jgi:hypothetical protein
MRAADDFPRTQAIFRAENLPWPRKFPRYKQKEAAAHAATSLAWSIFTFGLELFRV